MSMQYNLHLPVGSPWTPLARFTISVNIAKDNYPEDEDVVEALDDALSQIDWVSCIKGDVDTYMDLAFSRDILKQLAITLDDGSGEIDLT